MKVRTDLNAQAAKATVVPPGALDDIDQLFSDEKPQRLKAQETFLDQWKTNWSAIEALIDKALTHVTFFPGVYDTLSVLNRIPAGAISGHDFRDKTSALIAEAGPNSPDTAELAAKLAKRLEINTPTAATIDPIESKNAVRTAINKLHGEKFLDFKKDPSGITYRLAQAGIDRDLTPQEFRIYEGNAWNYYHNSR
jgi:hypothetical protein